MDDFAYAAHTPRGICNSGARQASCREEQWNNAVSHEVRVRVCESVCVCTRVRERVRVCICVCMRVIRAELKVTHLR